MRYLLLDIDDTIAPLKVGGPDTVTIDSMGIELSIPVYIANWLKNTNESDMKIYWCTDRPQIFGAMIEKILNFKTEGQLEFTNTKMYDWSKLYGVIDFCKKHPEDLVIFADNNVDRMIRNDEELPSNLKLVLPSKATLTIEDLALIDSL